MHRYPRQPVGTEKRERQRANRALKQQEIAKAQTRQRGTRIGLIVVGAVVAVLAIALIASVFIGDDDEPQTLRTEQFSDADGDADADGDGALEADADADPGADAEPAPTDRDGDTDPNTGEFLPEGCPPAAGTATSTLTFDTAPPDCIDPSKTYQALISTNKGEITVDLDQDKAPIAVNNFVFLARNRYFDNTICHRIIPEFVVQCGDPDGSGFGGPGYSLPDELPQDGEYEIGSVAMANSGPDTAGSQFFIVTGQTALDVLDPLYTLFGQVSDGFDDTVVQMEAAGTADGEPTEPIEIDSVTIIVS